MRINRRQFLKRTLVASGVGMVASTAYARFIEPSWIELREERFGEAPTLRMLQFSDLHYKGDREHAEHVINALNAVEADCIAFTGDLVEKLDLTHWKEAISLLSGLNKPTYAIPGNHDPRGTLQMQELDEALKKTGGAVLYPHLGPVQVGEHFLYGSWSLNVPKQQAGAKRHVLLTHYPMTVERAQEERFDLVLAGHSHGGQVRLPLFGPLYLPRWVGPYDRGRYETKLGPLYVNVGVGTFQWSVRFLCRPEITLLHV